MDAKDVILGTVAPILGCIVSTLMYASPLMAAHSARQARSIGELNPVPFAVTTWSTAIWVAYGFAANNPYMFPANILGLSASLYTSITTYALADDKTQVRMLALICTAAVVLPLLAVCSFFAMEAQAQRVLMWGLIANVVTILYYAAPLSTAVEVVRTRSSASLYKPTCVMNWVNGALWVAYGCAVGDFWIYIPNGAGVLCATILLVLCALYPATPPARGSCRDGTTTHLLASQPPSAPAKAQQQQAQAPGAGAKGGACAKADGGVSVTVDARGAVEVPGMMTIGTAVYRGARRSADLEQALDSSQL